MEEELVLTASSYAASHGILMGAKDPETRKPLSKNGHVYEPAPFSLHPTPFPKNAFETAYEMARPFNAVVHRAASDYTGWLRDAVQTAAAGDKDFTGKMVELADEVIAMGRVQNVTLGILRSDYMLHSPPSSSDNDDSTNVTSKKEQFLEAKPLQVELNTIASSFGCLSTKLTQMHKHIDSIITHHNRKQSEYSLSAFGTDDTTFELPENNAADGIAEGLALAYLEYNRQREEMYTNNPLPPTQQQPFKNVIVMVVQPGESNSCDQRDLEFILQQKHGIRVIRRTLLDLATTSKYAGNEYVYGGRELILPDDIDGIVSAAVVYYRAGYTPDDYPSLNEWIGRSIVEHSGAVKCPDIFYHIFGAKKIQQALSEPGNLKQFCSSEEETLLSSAFAGLYALGEGDDSEAVASALANPHGFVLKPQREGGGNNLYDDELVEALSSMSYEERGAYILMQKILPPSVPGKLIRSGEVVYNGPCVCELGVFGVSLRKYDDEETSILLDSVVGHILRTKSVKTDEGGVAAGYAFLSSPLLI